jgi:hypothetical protein
MNAAPAAAPAAGTQRAAALGTLLLGFVVVLAVTLLYIGNINFIILGDPPLSSAGASSGEHAGAGALQSQLFARRAPYPRYPGRDLLTSICGPMGSINNSDRGRDGHDGGAGDGWNATDADYETSAAEASGSSGPDSAEWQRVQRLIYESQHPAECSEDGTMQWVGAFEGFTAIGIGGQLSTLSLALGLAIVRNKVVVVADNSSQLTTCPQR